jgi:hypothetical protein
MTTKALFPTIAPSLLLDFANVKALDPRVTFARASSGAVYDGKTVAKAEENLFARSQEFNSTPTWSTPLRASIAADATTAPDGTSTADTLIEDGTTNSHYVHYATTTWPTGTYTLSVFAKLASGSRRLSLSQAFGGAVGYAIFDLSAGTVAATSGAHTASIVNAGNGWYRCIVTYTTTSTTARFDFALNAGGAAGLESYAGDGTSGIHLWGAQLEQRSAVTAYTPTTDQPITNYVPVLQSAANNVARFDHSPTTGESLGLLIEEQRTNLLTRSEEFNDSGWGKTGATVTANTVVAPDGALSADVLVENTANSAHGVFRAATTVSSTVYTGSVYVKAGGRGFCLVYTNAGAVGKYFSLPSGGGGAVLGNFGAGPTSASITYVGNDWYRCSITFTSTGTSTTLEVYSSSAGNNITYTGDGYSGIYIWGAQTEAGAFPTSYIPTVASQVTRSADAASMTGANFSSWYRADEGTLYASASLSGRRALGFENIAMLSAGASTSNSIGIGTQVVGNEGRAFSLVNGSATSDLRSGDIVLNVEFKIVYGYKVNDFALSFNAGTVQTDTSGAIPADVDRLTFRVEPTGSSPFAGHIRKLAYYPKRLSNSELVALTQN